MLVDTDVLIWYMRGNGKALRAIEALDEFSISVSPTSNWCRDFATRRN